MGKTIQVYGFPSNVSVDEIKEFLEKRTGEGTIEALEIKQPKNGGSMTYAKVQFTSLRLAEFIISLSKQLWYGRNYLKARAMDLDIIPKPRTFLHSMDQITLHFGCQMSKERFSVLWKARNVSVKFGSGLRKFYFFLSHDSVEYKLDLSYENIWKIQLQHPRGQITKFLLIQLFGVPQIYEKDVPVLSYFKETPDDQWVREIDFTPSCSIGQSSVLCLELPYGSQLPNFRENFAYYKENDGKFILESGSSFSPNLHLVPILGPPQGSNLPFKILFKINTLVQNGCLSGPTLDTNFFRLVDPQRINISYIEHALEKLYHLKECCYEPVRWLNEQYKTYISKQVAGSPAISLDTGLVYVRRVQITPCKVYFCGPEVNVSNRVLRNYPEDIDNFLHVSFLDECRNHIVKA